MESKGGKRKLSPNPELPIEINDPQTSSESGIVGFYETLLRRSKTLIHTLSLIPMYALATFCIGISLIPGVLTYKWISAAMMHKSALLYYPSIGITIALGYFLYGCTLVCLVPLVNFLLRVRLSPWKGPYYSVQSVKWYIHNGLTYLVRYTFLEFITPTPFNILFFKLMGMQIGRGAQINSSHISDPCLIELGEKVTIGGSATIVAHYGVGGLLVIAKVKIGKGATIGLKATIMGDVEIGDYAKILPNSVVLPKTRVPSGETWGGVPAQKIDIKN